MEDEQNKDDTLKKDSIIVQRNADTKRHRNMVSIFFLFIFIYQTRLYQIILKLFYRFQPSFEPPRVFICSLYDKEFIAILLIVDLKKKKDSLKSLI